MDWGGISCALVCAIPIVAIICDTVKKVFEMKTKLIKKHNPQSFLDDLKRVREVMVYAEYTNSYYQILKKDLLRDAERKAITYYITDTIFIIKRNVMVVI